MIRTPIRREWRVAGRTGLGRNVKTVPRMVGVLAAVLVVLSACGGGGGPGGGGTAADLGPAVDTNAVTIEAQKFTPASIVVAVGTEVIWSNKDRTSHTATAGAPGARTGEFDRTLGAGFGELKHTFDKAGVFPFYCQFHTTMRGQVEVK